MSVVLLLILQRRPDRSQFVNVYYWAQVSYNATCPQADHLINSVVPNLPNMCVLRISHAERVRLLTLGSQSPSVYVVFPSIAAYDGCQQIGQTFANLTTSFAPKELSTLRSDWSVYPFNFNDLPCPPADVPWNRSEGPYQPILAPPHFLFTIDPAFATCTPAASQGIDPYKPLKPAKQPTRPGHHFCRPGHCK